MSIKKYLFRKLFNKILFKASSDDMLFHWKSYALLGRQLTAKRIQTRFGLDV